MYYGVSSSFAMSYLDSHEGFSKSHHAPPLSNEESPKVVLQKTVLGSYLLEKDYSTAQKYCFHRSQELRREAIQEINEEKKRVSGYFIIVHEMLKSFMLAPEYLQGSEQNEHRTLLGDLLPYLLKYSSFQKNNSIVRRSTLHTILETDE